MAYRDLSKGQYSGTRLVGPIQRHDSSLDQFRFTIGERPVQCASPEFRDQGLAAEEDDTGFGLPRVSENLRKIQVIRQENVSIQASLGADFSIGRGNAAD